MHMQTGTYGSARHGLVCGCLFENGSLGVAISLPDAVVWLHREQPKAPGDFLWLHFNLADAAAEAWIKDLLDVVPAKEVGCYRL